jgi:hypothetical protein
VTNIEKIIDLAKVFEDRQFYPKTVEELRSIAQELEIGKPSQDFLRRVGLLYETLEEEFVDSLPYGQAYRRSCFREMKLTIFRAIERLGYKFEASTSVITPILQRMMEVDQSLIPVANLFDSCCQQCVADPAKYQNLKEIMFHLSAYMYIIDVEGIHDELARIFYFFTVVSKNNIPTTADLERITDWTVYDKLKPRPVFLHNLEEKKHIRNAIGHARTFYDAEKDSIRFIDVNCGKIEYDEILTTEEFRQTWMELIDTSAAFRFTVELLLLYEYL